MAPEDQSTAFSGFEKLTILDSHQVSVFAEFSISLGRKTYPTPTLILSSCTEGKTKRSNGSSYSSKRFTHYIIRIQSNVMSVIFSHVFLLVTSLLTGANDVPY